MLAERLILGVKGRKRISVIHMGATMRHQVEVRTTYSKSKRETCAKCGHSKNLRAYRFEVVQLTIHNRAPNSPLEASGIASTTAISEHREKVDEAWACDACVSSGRTMSILLAGIGTLGMSAATIWCAWLVWSATFPMAVFGILLALVGALYCFHSLRPHLDSSYAAGSAIACRSCRGLGGRRYSRPLPRDPKIPAA